jgi:hypothetical protein
LFVFIIRDRSTDDFQILSDRQRKDNLMPNTQKIA